MISNEEGGFLQRILLGLSVFQSTTRGSCIPASRGYGHWSVCGWRFCSSKDEREINISNWAMTMQWPADAASCPAVLTQLWRTWGNKAFMKPPPSAVQCNVTPWYWDTRSWESLLHTLNRCWGFHWPTGLTYRCWYHWNTTWGFYDGTDVHLNVSNFAVVWRDCVHMPWCLRRKIILGLYWERACGTGYLKKYF